MELWGGLARTDGDGQRTILVFAQEERPNGQEIPEAERALVGIRPLVGSMQAQSQQSGVQMIFEMVALGAVAFCRIAPFTVHIH